MPSTYWVVVPRAGIEPARPCSEAADFKSAVSTNFTIGALRRSVTGQRKLLMPANCSTNEKGKRYRFPFF